MFTGAYCLPKQKGNTLYLGKSEVQPIEASPPERKIENKAGYEWDLDACSRLKKEASAGSLSSLR